MDYLALHGLHLFFVVVLCAATAADVFLLRTKQATLLQPKELLESWRTRVAIAEMVAVLIVFGLGLSMWIPAPQNYPPHIFHTKMTLGLVYLVMGKIRMFKERKTKEPAIGMTKGLGIVLLLILCLGIVGGLHV